MLQSLAPRTNASCPGSHRVRRRSADWLLLAILLLPTAHALEPGVATPAGFREDRIIVRVADHANPGAVQRLHALTGTKVSHKFAHPRGGEVVTLPRGLGVAQALSAFQRSGLVEYAEPDFLLRAFISPNDFQYQNRDQWNLHNTGIYGGVPGADIMAEAAWDLQREAPNVIVAIIDTGVRYTHEDLAANMWVNPGESGLDSRGRDKRTNGVDDDGNGYVDDVHGINVLNGSGNPNDDWGHGTHVAGIVGAVTNNTVGVAGIAWRVQLMAVKFIDANANYSVSDAIVALDYARRHGARIVTASWGNYAFNSTAFRDAVAALRDAGIILTAAAGNDNSNNDLLPLYPASYGFDNIVAVAATTRTDDRATYSNYGATSVHLGAPGSPVFSTWAGSDRAYQYSEGTSFAAPHLAGACALLWARFPSDTHQQILQRIYSTVDPLPSLNGRTRTNGRLNLAAALASGSSTPPPPPPPPTGPAAPTGLTATSASSTTINLAWTDNATTETGFEIQRSTDNVNFILIGSAAANTTTATASGLTASTTYYFRVRAVQDGTPSAFSNTASATTSAASTPPPSGTWQSSDIGAVAATGSVSESAGSVTLTGSGADIWDNADEFRYRYQSWTGDGEIFARVTGLTNTHGWAKAGVMFRETLAANSRHALMCVSATNGTALQFRTATGGASNSISGALGSALPRWVRIVRSGSTLTGYESSNGTSWSQVGSVTISLPATIYVGLAVTSHFDGVLATAGFDQISLSGSGGTPPPPPPAAPAAPSGLAANAVSATQIDLTWTDNSNDETGFQLERSTDQVNYTAIVLTGANVIRYSDTGRNAATTYFYRVRAVNGAGASSYSNVAAATTPPVAAPGDWAHADIGAVGVPGSSEASGNTLTVRGSGSDVWGSADAFRFVHRQLSGDCVVEARISSLDNTDAWAKAGVMIRESLAPNARNVFAFLTPQNGVNAQARPATGGTTVSSRGSWWVTTPYWVRLVRSGNRITAYESSNGVSWSQVIGYDVALSASVYVGLAVTSHDNARLNTAVFADPLVR